jgi:CNT family concentrative nucleoside transporter
VRDGEQTLGDSERWQGLIGVILLLGLGWALSENRRRIPWKLVAWGLLLQLVFALVILRTDAGKRCFSLLNNGVNQLIGFANEGSAFLFRPLSGEFEARYTVVDSAAPAATSPAAGETAPRGESPDLDAAPVPAAERPLPPGAQLDLRSADGPRIAPPLVNIAFFVLPTVIFFSALLAVLYHVGVMQLLVKGIAWVMVRTMGTSGAETLCVAANIFVGQTEAPLLVRPFLGAMTRSELMTVMVGGFATIAGGVLALYVSILQRLIPDIAGHLMAASVMSAPAALLFAKILCPETHAPQTLGRLHIDVPRTASNALEAFGEGVTQGLQLALNIGAMLLAFVAAVALVNGVLGLFPSTGQPWSLQALLGDLFRPVAWALGVNWDEAETLGTLLGEKLALTELVAYSHLSTMESGADISPRTAVIASYALCGFANFASVGIQLGGIGAMAPERRGELAELAFRAMLGGALASWLTAAIAGLLL